jgi:hypothetical protein
LPRNINQNWGDVILLLSGNEKLEEIGWSAVRTVISLTVAASGSPYMESSFDSLLR